MPQKKIQNVKICIELHGTLKFVLICVTLRHVVSRCVTLYHDVSQCITLCHVVPSGRIRG